MQLLLFGGGGGGGGGEPSDGGARKQSGFRRFIFKSIGFWVCEAMQAGILIVHLPPGAGATQDTEAVSPQAGDLGRTGVICRDLQ